MRKPRDDFHFVSELLTAFFRQPSLKSALRVIQAREITGWEVWIQVELARFLSEHETGPEWYREESLQFDYRIEKTRYFFKPDFIIRKKGAATGRYIALEIKQHRQAGNCVSNMVSDLVKVSKMRRSEIDLRSFWALGIFQTEHNSDVETIIQSKLEAAGLEFHKTVVAFAPIGRTPFSYALF